MALVTSRVVEEIRPNIAFAILRENATIKI
jgi:hypothetical protein